MRRMGRVPGSHFTSTAARSAPTSSTQSALCAVPMPGSSSTALAVETAISLSGFGVDVLANSALVLAEDQPAGTRSVKVAYLLVPGPSWVSVIAIKDGLPAEVLGRMWRAAGEYQQIVVPLDDVSSPGEVVVTVHQDAGSPESLRIRPGRPARLGRPAVSLCGRDREQADTPDRQVDARDRSRGWAPWPRFPERARRTVAVRQTECDRLSNTVGSRGAEHLVRGT